MGDQRFREPYERLARAEDRARVLRQLSDDEVIQALAHASRASDPLLANVIATESLNRMRRSRVVAQSIGEGVLGFDENARINFANPAAQFILGKNEGEILGRGWSEAAFDKPFVREECPVVNVLRTGRASPPIEEAWRRPGGESAVVEWTLYPIELDRQTVGVVAVFRDVTERKRASESIFESEKRYRTLYENAPWGILTIGLDGAIIEANASGLEATGRTLEEVRGHAFGEFLHEGDLGKVATLFERVLAGERQQTTLRIRHKDGSHIHAEALGLPIEREGEVVAVHGLWWHVRDVDEGREERYRVLVQSVRDYAIFMLSPHGVIESWNPGAERIKGYTADEVLGRHFSIFYPPDAIESGWPERELEIARERGAFEEEGWRVRKDGSRFWANITITAMRDAKGELVGFAKVTRDLTDRKRSEEDLRRSEERHRLLVESVTDYAIFMLDPEGRISSWNAGAQRIKGYAASEVLGKHFRMFYPQAEQDRRHPEEELKLALRDGRYEEEGWRVRKDGGRFWANVVITSLYDERGQHRGFAKITRDLTARKLQEDERGRRETSQARAKELESFIYTVAHDLRAPLRGVAALVTDVRDSPANALDDAARESLDRAVRATHRMYDLIADLLNLGKASHGELDVHAVDVTKMARHVAKGLREREPDRVVDFDVEESLVARADPGLFRIVLDNLLGNAWKFTRGAARPIIRLSGEVTPTQTILRLRDNGAGFDPARAREMFEPFRRLHGSEFEGTGIGLATVRKIVERHGGSIAADGKPGAGATFTIQLPR